MDVDDQLVPSLSLSIFLVPYEETAGVKYNASTTVLKRLRKCLLQLESEFSHLLSFAGGLKTIEIETASASESSSSSNSSDDLECDEAKELSRLSRVVFSLDVTSSQQLVQLKKFLDSGQLNLWLTEHVQPKVKGLKFFRVILGKAYYMAARRKLRSLEKRARKQASRRSRQTSGSSDTEVPVSDTVSRGPHRLKLPKLPPDRHMDFKSWILDEEYAQLPHSVQSCYVKFEFRLYIVDAVQHVVDQASKNQNLLVDEEKALTSAMLNATCDMTASLVLTNTKRNQSSSIEYKITKLCDFYSLPVWRVFILAADIGNSEYCYELRNCDKPAAVPDLEQMDTPSSAGVAATVSAAKVSDIIVQNCPNRCFRLIDGALKEFETRPLNAGRRVCLEAFLRPYLQSIAREPVLFWKIFAFHAASLAVAGSQTVLDNAEPSVFINQCCSVLIETWIESVITDKIKADSVKFISAVTRYFSAGFGSLKPGGKLMLCRVSLHIHQKFEANGDTFWPKDAAQWLLQCLQQPDLGSVDFQSVFFLDSYLPSFLHLCHCAQLLHSSESPANFILLVDSLGFIERAADKFRAALAQFLLCSGLVRELNSANFVMIFSSMFDDAESNPALSDLLIEFLSINEVAETAKAFESCECLSSSSLKLVKDCSSQVLFNKQLAELKTQEWKPLCEITAKAKRLQFESLALWHAEGVPVVRAAVIDSIGSEIENENSAANRRALSDLLSLSGLFDEQFALKFMSIVFSSDCQWLIKLCLDSFDSALLSHIEASDSDELPAVLAQFIRLSCNYYCKSTCSVVSFLLKRSKNCHFRTVCLDCGKGLLAEQPLTKASIEINIRDAQNTAELLRIIFDNFYQRISSSSNESDTDLILDWLQENAPAFSSEFLYKSLCEIFGLSLEHLLSVQPSQQRPTSALELLPLLLERNFMWMWMTSDSDPSIQPLAEAVRLKLSSKMQCIADFARVFFNRDADKHLSLADFREFVAIFERLKKAGKLVRGNIESSLYDYFDLLLKAFFVNFGQDGQTKKTVRCLEQNERSWNEQCTVVDQIFNFLFLISGENSRMNLKLLDLNDKQSRYQSLKQQFFNSIGSFGSDDLVFQIFEIRNVQNLELMKSLVQSELFRRVFVRSKPASGGSRNLFEAESQSAVYSRPGALITVQCSYVLDKMLPDACTAYKQFWVEVERGSLLLGSIESFISEGSKLEFKLEEGIVSNLGISSSVVDKFRSIQSRDIWLSRMHLLQFFLTEFFTSNQNSTESPEESYASGSEVSDDENTKCVASFCKEAFINHEDATALIEEFISHCESTASLSEYLEVFQDVHGAFGRVDPNVWEVLASMYDCRKETLPFLREQQSSDFQQLLDNTDDTIAQDLSLSVINSLISLQQALRSFLSSSPRTSVKALEQSVLQALKYFEAADNESNIQNEVNQRQKAAKNLIDRIKECNGHINSIKTLHASMGSRGETSKLLAIGSIVGEKEAIRFLIKTPQCDCTLKRSVGSSESEYTLSQLRDHRSRIIISLSSQKDRSSVEQNDSVTLKEFVHLIDLLENTFDTAERLLKKGHPLFANHEFCGSLSACEDELKELQVKEASWDKLLQDLRLTHHLANYVFGSNLLKLFQVFYLGHEKRDIMNILYFMKVDGSSFDEVPLKNLNIDKLDASELYQLFDEMFSTLDALPRIEPRVFKSLPIQKTDMCVRPGELLVCQMNPAEKDVISIFLNVWISTQKEFPWISEVVFCSQDTVSDEVVLALKRCAREDTHTTFLVEVQNLRQKVLRELIAELIQQQSQRKLGRVAILCRAADSHSIFTVFRDNVVKAKSLTEEKLKIVLKDCFSDVFFCTSDRPSVVKSEQIVTASCKRSQDFSRIHISGFVQKQAVMEKIQKASITKNAYMHIDIGSVQNADLLELILFEAVFCQTLSTAQAIVQFRPKALYLEIANSIDKELEDSFTLFSSLPDAKCEWKHLKNLEVSSKPTSPIQIVCKYLYLLATNTVDDTEVNLTDCVPSNVCLNLLGQFFNHPLEDGKRPSEIMSFLVLESCLKILGEQLKKFTASAYFRVKNLQLVYGGRVEIRAKMVGLIMQSTLKLTLKSVSSIKYQQSESRKNVFDHTVQRFRGLINWEDFSYVLPVFINQDISKVELIYRRLTDVTHDIRDLFSVVLSQELREFSTLSQNELFQKLVKIASKGQIGYIPALKRELTENYTLTADNFLKMLLITLRMDADVPVIIIGETGCGKTSLIRYLAAVQECTLEVMNFHAGISESDIIERVSKAAEVAESQLKEFVELSERSGIVWMFLDDINTCEHLGMLKEIVCHRRFLDRELPCNLRFIAACNPYVLRPKCDNSKHAGLEIKELRNDKMMNLVYRVHPLPETMVELVWDFGRLTDSDEHAYISQMVALSIPQKILRKEITEFLSIVQKFIRKLEDSEYATSLRDVRRFCEFYKFFIDYFKKKVALVDPKSRENQSKKAFLFSLYICYYVRIADLHDRNDFAEKICGFFDKTAAQIQDDFVKEELDVLKRMRVPRKTARNLALRENVFILFCCIYCQVPVLLVGKPGCSKSLAVNLIRSNLRGKDSEDPLFRQYPSLRFFSYQGSEASTSEGIRRIFCKAENSIDACKAEDSKPIVLIDEIGLAEKSRYNPLKVLHSLLEPESSLDCKSRVSVVGISNWALDPAKMNRAIHISRPDMNEDELCETGKAICASDGSKSDKLISDEVLNRVAVACHRYFKDQPFENFHGLRDFYYLLKFICDRRSDGDNQISSIKEGLLRNFNGDKSSRKQVMRHFEDAIPGLKNAEILDHSISSESVTEALINRNLRDSQARHLMLIYESEGCLDLLCFMLSQNHRTFKVMYGSQYEKDQHSEKFTYRKLNEVMMCMETGMVLILKDFDLIYSSLYDMLNQNYSEYAGRKYCRIAMGVQANQNCVVHRDFRCVVLVSKKEVRRLDPPFLNRFEKQVFDFEDKICSMKLEKARNGLSSLMDNLCRIVSDDVVRTFKRTEVFQGYTPDLVASYLIQTGRSDLEDHQAIREILPLLSRHMFPDAVLRTTYSKFERSRQYQQEYFDTDRLMTDLGSVMRNVTRSEELIQKVFVYTKFSLYLDIVKPLLGLESHSVKEIRLMDFSREIDLLDSIVPFFKENKSDGVLLARIKPSIDERYILHVRCLVDGLCQRYSEEISVKKSIVFIIHLQHEDLDVQNYSWNWSPLIDWKAYFTESLNPESDVCLSELVLSDCASSMFENTELIEGLHKSVVTSAFADAIRSPEMLDKAVKFFSRSTELEKQISGFIVEEMLTKSSKNVQPFSPDHWLVKLALETTQLANFPSFSTFVMHGIKTSYKESLVKVLKAMSEFGIFTENSSDSDLCVRVLASCPGGGDPSVHWELLEAALAKRLLGSKGFGCVEPWEGRLKGATERDLGTLVSAFRQMCQCERLSEAELAAFQRRQKEDSSRAARTAALCRTLLGFCHRIGVPSGACTVAEFLQQHAGSLAGGAALAEAEAEGAVGLALSKVPALLEAAEQEQFSVIFADLQRRFGGHEEAAERVAASVHEGDKPALLALLKSACVRLLMADSTQCGLTMADLLADASLLPVGAPELRLRSDPALDKPAVELLFLLAHCLHRSEQNKTKGQRKF
ncbi:hypothetical protein BOX15_Mlig008706g1 [Macrostomum lignano]|uniref:AAA+ ATPase domain-containing protein n=1 Tax=Macrostomum lignano TaxID=282301 RepID=A0A267F022_9PLAT|nr:hypothetical protein BOX15_Mlig008706g1 [Macrostomum lignano]